MELTAPVEQVMLPTMEIHADTHGCTGVLYKCTGTSYDQVPTVAHTLKLYVSTNALSRKG